jgi:hypothetical protein
VGSFWQHAGLISGVESYEFDDFRSLQSRFIFILTPLNAPFTSFRFKKFPNTCGGPDTESKIKLKSIKLHNVASSSTPAIIKSKHLLVCATLAKRPLYFLAFVCVGGIFVNLNEWADVIIFDDIETCNFQN